MESKVKFSKYQSRTLVRLDVYQTFGEATQEQVNNVFAFVERDAGTVFLAAQKAGYEVEEVQPARMYSGYSIKVSAQVRIKVDLAEFEKKKIPGIEIKD
jgi:hypothetical protein